jgi:hypothetical protein
MSDGWRMAFMFDARGGDQAALEAGLAKAAEAIRRAAGEAQVRLGVPDDSSAMNARQDGESYDIAAWRGVDGAVEITVADARSGDLTDIARSVHGIIAPLAAPGSVEVMAGPMFCMVPVRDGEAFLSLAFKRYPGTTSEDFRNWWRFQHAKVAIPVLGAPMLAYDQVHVDPGVTEALARAIGVEPVLYDAYDNLTYENAAGFLASVADLPGMARIAEDELGRIDNTSRRHALMKRVG